MLFSPRLKRDQGSLCRRAPGTLSLHPDAEVINQLGVAAKLVETLGYDKSGGATLVAGFDQPHLCPCMHIDDKFVIHACGWAAAALAVMAVAGLLP